MSDQVQYLTPDGLRELEARLDHLRNVRRPEVAARLHQAIDDSGNLAENAAYIDAKHDQGFIEGEIQRLEVILSNARLIENNSPQDVVGLGDKVKVLEVGQRRTETFQIVGAPEANPAQGRISHESPLGQALIGHQAGEHVIVRAPGGDIVFVIKAILPK
jgi:transcription elongation factor GreA